MAFGWDPLEQRWKVRRELCEYLLNIAEMLRTRSPTSSPCSGSSAGRHQRQKEAASLLLHAGLWPRALEEYQAILKSNPRDEDALTGAGTAVFNWANIHGR